MMTKLDRAGYIFIGIVLVIGIYLGFTDPERFDTRFAQEDGFVENVTAIALLGLSILCAIRLYRFRKIKPFWWKAGTFIFALLFFFAAGEEISWGQRIFGWETGDFFEDNLQNETNLHNLEIGETNINKLIFSQILTGVMVIYLLIVPFLFRRKQWMKNLLTRFAVPVVHRHHTIAFIIVTIVVLIIPASRVWEVYEMAFSIIFLLIFIHPLNKEIFQK